MKYRQRKPSALLQKKEIHARFNDMKYGSAPVPDGMEKKHLGHKGSKRALSIFFNIILKCQTQPRNWKITKTILIPKPGKDQSNIENLRPITFNPIKRRMYWGIVDQRLRGYTAFPPRQKGFVSKPGCFNYSP
jgi:hypothetical protein